MNYDILFRGWLLFCVSGRMPSCARFSTRAAPTRSSLVGHCPYLCLHLFQEFSPPPPTSARPPHHYLCPSFFSLLQCCYQLLAPLLCAFRDISSLSRNLQSRTSPGWPVPNAVRSPATRCSAATGNSNVFYDITFVQLEDSLSRSTGGFIAASNRKYTAASHVAAAKKVAGEC